MKRSELEKELRREAQAHTPDVYESVLSSANKAGLFAQTQTAPVRKREKKGRVWLRAVACTAAAAVCLAVVLPFALSHKGETSVPLSLSAQDVYGIGAVTAVGLLGGSEEGASAFSCAAVYGGAEEAKAEAENFHAYFKSLGGFLGDDLVTTKAEQNPDTEEKYAQYEVKLTVTGRDMYGEAVVHVMYYTETLVKEKTDEEEGKSKATYSLEGVMSAEGTDYILRGEREAEEERDESEQEIKIRAYPDESDLQTYVQMKQEFSVESDETEKEYVYSVVKDGVLLEETAVEFETERKGGKEETEIKLQFRQGEAKGEYAVLPEGEGCAARVRVNYRIGAEKGTFYVSRNKDGSYEYLFSDDTVKILR